VWIPNGGSVDNTLVKKYEQNTRIGQKQQREGGKGKKMTFQPSLFTFFSTFASDFLMP
jgi:hypothetical protein